MSERNGCTCKQVPCVCPYRIEVQRTDGVLDPFDTLVGMRWLAVVRHPTIDSALTGSFYAYTAKRAERKARRWIARQERDANSLYSIEVPRKGRT